MARTPCSFFTGAALALLFFTGCAHQRDDTPRVDNTPLPRVPAMARVAPDFSFRGAQVHTLRGLRGQAVVLVIADSPRTGAFKKQLRNLEEYYSDFASRQTVFVAAFKKQEADGAVKSNVPFIIASNGAAVAAAYGADHDDMYVAIIGKDQNLDYITSKKLPGARVRDVIQNSYSVQTSARR
ncbi:MAG TPA: hypothetical protein VGO11_12065 [Chthoniobacteraceae bacterium]|jgi:hypothetical protein|nr:hypothetical protein [Chthoniobacteraceae bacterium]